MHNHFQRKSASLVAVCLIVHGWQPWSTASSKYKNRGNFVTRLSDSFLRSHHAKQPFLKHLLTVWCRPWHIYSYKTCVKTLWLLWNMSQYDHCCHINTLNCRSSLWDISQGWSISKYFCLSFSKSYEFHMGTEQDKSVQVSSVVCSRQQLRKKKYISL